MPDRYAVIGNPIEHSKSPLIHAAFARQSGQDIAYGRILAPLDGFAFTVQRLQSEGYRGCNVTVPFKTEAFRLALPTARARDAEAVNTLVFENGRMFGDNTDGAGLMRDIQHNLGVSLRQRRVLLLGAGGAAQGVLHPLLEAEPALLVIVNRTLDKAQALQKRAETAWGSCCVTAQTFDDLAGQSFDTVVNATSAGLTDQRLPLPQGLFAPGALAYDMMYGRETPFLAFAREQGAARIADGLGMLVEQAAEAFTLWRGVRPETAPVMAQLRG